VARARKAPGALAAAGAGAADVAAAGADAVAVLLEPIARQALGEITRAAHVGVLRDVVVDGHVATVRFATTQGGYPGWNWTVSIAVNPGMDPSVLETELMPVEGALVAPDWVPWADRLDDYLAQQALDGELASADASLDDDDVDDADDDADDDDDHDDDDLDGDHGDDVFDGVDIDLHLDDEPHPSS